MKKIAILIALVCLVGTSKALACGGEADWESAEPFRVIEPLSNDDAAYRKTTFEETVDFWYNYLQKKLKRDVIKDYFEGARIQTFNEDKKSNAFLKALAGNNFALGYIKACLQLQSSYEESWEYDRNDKGADQALATLKTLQVPQAFTYRVALLKMRCAMSKKDYRTVEQLWTATGSKCSDSKMKRRLEGYYAGALYGQGRFQDALAIYSELGDRQSMNRCISNYVGYKGISQLVKTNAPKTTLYYAVQDYAQHYWETVCKNSEYLSEETLRLTKQDGQNLKKIAQQNMNGDNAAMWTDFLAWLYMCEGNYQDAWDNAQLVMGTNANKLQKETADRIIMLSRLHVYSNKMTDNNLRQLAADLKELTARANREYKQSTNVDYENIESNWGKSYNTVHSPNYCFLQCVYRPDMLKVFKDKTMMTAYVVAEMAGSIQYSDDSQAGDACFGTMNSILSADEAVMVYQALKTKKPQDAFSKELVKDLKYDDQQMQDIVGTQLMRAGKYGNALPYLQALKPEYLKKQGYQWYLANRTFKFNKPFQREQFGDPYDTEGEANGTNYKAAFCKEMVNDITKLPKLSGEEKAKMELDMAQRMFHASEYGDMWALSDFSWTSWKEDGKMDLLCNQARNMLKAALKDCQTENTKFLVYMGLALVPSGNPFWTMEYDWKNNTRSYKFNLFNPAREAYDYLKTRYKNSPYTSKCDVLKWYAVQHNY